MAIPEKIYETNGAEETFEVGMRLAKEAKAGDIYCLDGDLGTGKTVFSQGFAAGLGIKEAVNSPTFTIVCEYEEGRLPLYHFDVYRIGSSDEMYDIGYEEYINGEGVCIILMYIESKSRKRWKKLATRNIFMDRVCVLLSGHHL